MKNITLLPTILGGSLLAMLCAAPAHAQATRTWVSGAGGSDANPCSRTAPCSTFSGAISKTATGGEINCIDAGGFGAVTIAKAITIDCGGTFGSILAAGTNGITVNSAGAKVTLRNLSIDGAGTGINGVNIISGSTVLLENVQIFGFTGNGINTSSLAATANIMLRKVSFATITGAGVLATTSSGFAIVQVSDSSFFGGAAGISVANNGFVSVTNSVFSQATTAGAQTTGVGTLNVDSSVFTNNVAAVTAGVNGTVRVSNNSLFDNTSGFVANGTMISAGNNKVVGGSTATPPTTLPIK